MSHHKTHLVKGGEAEWFFFSLSALFQVAARTCVKPIPLPTSTAIAVAQDVPALTSRYANASCVRRRGRHKGTHLSFCFLFFLLHFTVTAVISAPSLWILDCSAVISPRAIAAGFEQTIDKSLIRLMAVASTGEWAGATERATGELVSERTADSDECCCFPPVIRDSLCGASAAARLTILCTAFAGSRCSSGLCWTWKSWTWRRGAIRLNTTWVVFCPPVPTLSLACSQSRRESWTLH